MNISLICACKNRYNALKLSLNSWLMFDEVKEVIIVDWSSDKPIDDLLSLDSRIKIIRVNGKEHFNLSQPLNLASSIATGEYILKVDCDYIINPYWNFFKTYKIDENSFLSGNPNYQSPEYVDENGCSKVDFHNLSIEEIMNYCNSYSDYFKYLKGLLFVSKENFLQVNGYDEDIRSYGWEDSQIIQRLEELGLEHKKISFDYRIIHIPHPDRKRFEHSKEYTIEEENYFKSIMESQYSPESLPFQVDYALVMHYIEKNKQSFSKEKFKCIKTEWCINLIGENYYSAVEVKKELDKSKLKYFPSVHYITLEESTERQNELEKQFKEYDILPIAIKSKRFAESDDKIVGKYVYQLNDGTKGCCVSHLKAIKTWYENTDEDYGFFCEDDLSLDTIPFWNFNWENFIESIPEDAECVQLFTIRDEYDTIELRERYWNDWGVTAYILTRDYAKKIIDTYIKDNEYLLEIPNQDIMPLIENILFASVGKTYTIPLFVENTKFNSTFVGYDDDVKDGHKTNHKVARELVLNYWKNISKQTELKKTELENLLTKYSLDTENAEHNFNLGVWYENEGHTAPALSYFLRCAERSEDEDLAYEALIRGSYCYEKQGERDGSSRSLLWQAQAFRPDRPEAYFLLSRYAERRQWWQDTYMNADLALRFCNFEQKPLRTDVEYPGKYGLLFEKAVSGWWWGKTEESKELMLSIFNDYDLSESYRQIVLNNLKIMGISIPEKTEIHHSEFAYSQNFDWGSLTYEDIITIEREVIHEKVYRFWRDVKEGDVVLDIGASVGAYTISILDQKPKKVYCVEPSKKLLDTLSKNCLEKIIDYQENPLVCINCGIVSDDTDKINIFGGEEKFTGISFNNLINEYSIDHINYMKIDCEGGEYNIFKDENMDFLKNKVDFIAMEVHLNYEGCRQKFKNFRDNYLIQFKNYKVMSCTRQHISWGTSLDIKQNIFDNNFIDNYTCEFMIYISNN